MISPEQMRKIVPFAGEKIFVYCVPINDAMDEFGIDTPLRQAAFIAQVAHESGSFAYVKELASGEAYEGRKDLGNTEPGDGVKYKGRGLIQITGRANYAACSAALFGKSEMLIDHPELLENTKTACRSAAWFWSKNGLNALADEGKFEGITRRINGGFNGLADRLAFYKTAKEVLAC